MHFAVHYSRPAADLLRAGQITLDYFRGNRRPHHPTASRPADGSSADDRGGLELLAWALAEIGQGKWGQPWIMAFECGVGPLWEAVTDTEAWRAQVPRLHAMIQETAQPPLTAQ